MAVIFRNTTHQPLKVEGHNVLGLLLKQSLVEEDVVQRSLLYRLAASVTEWDLMACDDEVVVVKLTCAAAARPPGRT